jgi:predicted O-linked N-acetylglucosamine transferase (SPINDLY family)
VTVAWQAELNAIVQRAKVARDAGQWRNAIALYAKANEIDGVRYDIKHNLALSLIAVNRVDDGLLYLSHALALKPDLWPSHVLKAKVMRGRGLVEEADSVLTHILKHDPRNGHALLAAADLDMNEFGDAVGARERVAPLLSDPAFKGEAELTTLMSKLYDRDESDEELSYMLMDFAKRELSMPGFTFSVEAMAGVANRTGRKRVGLLSPMFCASPVYFLTILTFRQLAKSFDLIILNRGAKEDWGTKAFRDIAAEWHNVQNVDAETLANAIKKQSLDVLFDLGGWSDPIGLKALSVKPAKKMYKWVGGQSATTGLTTFDGFLTDEIQSPPGSEALHSEPLVRLPGGYVSYVAPPYLPRHSESGLLPASNVVAVAGNPAKLSRSFMQRIGRSDDELVFIDKRYAYSRTTRRIDQALKGNASFRSPSSHHDYMKTINHFQTFMDSCPYSSGLTAAELIVMGKKIIPSPGQLVSSRHCQSHLHYAEAGTLSSDSVLVNWSKKTWLN